MRYRILRVVGKADPLATVEDSWDCVSVVKALGAVWGISTLVIKYGRKIVWDGRDFGSQIELGDETSLQAFGYGGRQP